MKKPANIRFMTMKKKNTAVLTAEFVLLILIGFGIMLYPVISNMAVHGQTSGKLPEYHETIKSGNRAETAESQTPADKKPAEKPFIRKLPLAIGIVLLFLFIAVLTLALAENRNPKAKVKGKEQSNEHTAF